MKKMTIKQQRHLEAITERRDELESKMKKFVDAEGPQPTDDEIRELCQIRRDKQIREQLQEG